MTGAAAIEVGGTEVAPASREHLELPVARLPTGTHVDLPVVVVHGAEPGPRLWLNAALHGDEVNGIEIIRRVLRLVHSDALAGTLVAVPIVNVFGFIDQSRYLPDRRDLNRSFPGSKRGSLAARIAHLFMREIVEPSTHGIDLHTGSHHRTNLAQVRGDLSDDETRRCAEAFAAPVMVSARRRKGSLRAAATKLGKPLIVYEAGEPQRFNEHAISAGTDGVLRVLRALAMIDDAPDPSSECLELASSRWVRASGGGILRLDVRIGEHVKRGDRLGVIADPFGERERAVTSRGERIVIGHTTNPIVNQGDGIVNLGKPLTKA